MLEEDYKATSREQIKLIQKKLFDTKIDIEHIQSYNDKDGKVRQEILKEWAHHINSIGNLMVLEHSINRSISNNPYEAKIKRYPSSAFEIVKNQHLTYDSWSLDRCKERKEKEKQKMLNYLFN